MRKYSTSLVFALLFVLGSLSAVADERKAEVGPLIPYRTSRIRSSLLIPYRGPAKTIRSPASASR